MRYTLIGITLLFLVGLNAIGLVSPDTRFASVNYFKANQAKAEQPASSGTTERTEKRVQDTRHLCDKPYPGPGGKADCEMAKKLLADPHYIKM